MHSFSDIETRDDFFNCLKIPRKNMTYLLYRKGTENSYHTFIIKKKNGGERTINAPDDKLKLVQKRLASLLWETQKNFWINNNINPNISHAFEKEKSIITNAQIHRNKRFILNIDLEDFFYSFHFGRIKGFFEKDMNFKVPQEVALIIAQIACYKGTLPQGAPSSPIITNLICKILDFRLLKLARRYKLDYTRYADDLTFSTNNQIFLNQKETFMRKVEGEIERAGFKINTKKTRFQYDTSRQEVTGLIVNKKVNVSREYYKNTRAMANNLYKNGEFMINGITGTISQLEGRFSFINQIDRYNNNLEYKKSLNRNNIEYQKFLLSTEFVGHDHYKMLQNLNSREREYQKFIYYKYFYNNDRPIIITEGKTDINYFKAALKNLYKDYPTLIEKKGDQYFYKISFLKRSKRLKYFFNLPLDGADAMKNLYNLFCDYDNTRYPNFLKYFNTLSSSFPTNPTVFIFDNELSNDKKPLKNFMTHVYKGNENQKIRNDKIEALQKNLHIKISDNLYLLTNQLIGDSKENEIEDLFDSDTLNHKIDGKVFSKKSTGENYYGKEILSKYVLDNFDNINFENFRPILNNLNSVICDYNKTLHLTLNQGDDS